MIPIRESYKDYWPPQYAQSTIAKLLLNLPTRCLSGLECVVLTNATAIGKGKTIRVKGRKYLRKNCLGFYHPKLNREQAWIEIVVDNIVASFPPSGVPRLVWSIPFFREMRFAKTLFHEIGHHLNHTIGPLASGAEETAEAWRKRLLGLYLRKKYWYLVPVARLVGQLRRREAPSDRKVVVTEPGAAAKSATRARQTASSSPSPS
jgi:hypothetical protein